MQTWVYIAIWIFFSSSTILFNKWILSEGGFPYPIILTTCHMLFTSIATTILLFTTNLLPSLKEVTITREIYLKNIVPISVFFAASLIFYNKAYLYLSVSFIQMLKAATPVVVLLLSFATRLETPSWTLFLIIMTVSTGVGLASYGEIHFVLIGVIYQIIGIMVESVRLILVQILLAANGLKLDPLSGLFLYAPFCFVLNSIMFFIFEYPTFSRTAFEDLGFGILLANAATAFCLNVAVVYLLKNSSSVVFTLSGVLKDILLIISSAVVFFTSITMLQTIGYSIALTGIVLYNLIKLKKPLDLKTVAGVAVVVTASCLVFFQGLDYYNTMVAAKTGAYLDKGDHLHPPLPTL